MAEAIPRYPITLKKSRYPITLKKQKYHTSPKASSKQFGTYIIVC